MSHLNLPLRLLRWTSCRCAYASGLASGSRRYCRKASGVLDGGAPARRPSRSVVCGQAADGTRRSRLPRTVAVSRSRRAGLGRLTGPTRRLGCWFGVVAGAGGQALPRSMGRRGQCWKKAGAVARWMGGRRWVGRCREAWPNGDFVPPRRLVREALSPAAFATAQTAAE